MANNSLKPKRFPVFMDDSELFCRETMGPRKHPEFNEQLFEQMFHRLGRLWWSRLVIACRGYAVSDFKASDEIVFAFDDASVLIHQRIVEAEFEMALQLLHDVQLLENSGSEALRALFDGRDLPDSQNPFFVPTKRNAFQRLFGEPCAATYKTAFMRGFCYLVFFNVTTKMQQKWAHYVSSMNGSMGVSEVIGKELEPFQDPDWRPDERVVMFHQLRPGLKAWVLTDFDRYIIKYWRPNGVRVIFGYEYVESKIIEGLKLCGYCGLLESYHQQFKRCFVCEKQKSDDPVCYCSEDCEDLNRANHIKQHQANPKVTFNI